MCTARALSVVLCAGAFLLGSCSAAAVQWVTFDASAHPRGSQSAPGAIASPIRGLLLVPLEPGRHPAVVLLPSCEGPRPFHHSWAQTLSERGYVALLVDDFFMLDRGRTCGLSDPAARADVLARRVQAARAAARYLASRVEVDRARVAVMGWGDAPLDVLIGEFEGAGSSSIDFAAAVAIVPTQCVEGTRGSRPRLVLRAQAGAPGSEVSCKPPADATSLEINVYAGTRPGFDDPRAVAERASPQWRYDPLAHRQAIEDVAAFLHRELTALPARGAQEDAPRAKPNPIEVGSWAVDPGEPGPDLPPAGGSAFDAVFSRATPEGVVHDIPFPFSSLLQRLAWAAGAQRMARSPLDATLIPLGRSLQREAAAPDYFASPRLVVAVTGAPDDGSGPLGVKLENRLFLGYQPRSEVLEIISYNEAAARFEFQVVHGYGPERALSARYARRALCLSCHQNAAPIFADASWGETTADAQVARRLQALGPIFHGVAVAAGDRAVVAIDIAADQASLLPVYQRLWSEGCASDDAREVAACRAGALQAMLQYRLSNAAGFDRHAPLYAGGYLPVQRRNWHARWPQGLLIPDSNLPDRAPLMSPSPSLVPSALDPLNPRPPMARWQASFARDLERMVRGLSRELPEQHVTLLDRHLRAGGEGAPGRELSAPCQIVRRGFAGEARLYQIECTGAGEQSSGFALLAQVHVSADGAAQGTAALEIDGGSHAQRTVTGRLTRASRIVLQLSERDGASPVRAPDGATPLRASDGATPIRAPDGNTIGALALSWNQDLDENAARIDAKGTLTVLRDFLPVAAAIARLAANAGPDSPLLADRFDGVRLSHWLLHELDVPSDAPCCAVLPLPAPRLAVDTPATHAVLAVELEHRGPLQTFNHFCGACHGGDTIHPPGFLHGEGQRVLDALARCAERIYFRLSMWQRDSAEQAVPPMPPMNGLRLAHTTAQEWRASESLQRLTAYARARITGEGRDPDAVLAGRYHAARSCLAGVR